MAQKVVIRTPTTQGILQEKPHPHALHAQSMVDTPSGRVGTIGNPEWGGLKGDSYEHKPHESDIYLCQTQAQ